MPEPSSGFPTWTLINGVQLSFWWESESEGLWFIYRNPGEFEWRGGGLFFQLGEDYLANKTVIDYLVYVGHASSVPIAERFL